MSGTSEDPYSTVPDEVSELEPVARASADKVAWRRADVTETATATAAWKPPSSERLDARPANDDLTSAGASAGEGSFGRRLIPPGVVRHLSGDSSTRGDRAWISWLIAGGGAILAALLGMMLGGKLAI